MSIAIHVPRINVVCPIHEECWHILRLLHEMRQVEVANVDLWNVQPLTDQSGMAPAVSHILAGVAVGDSGLLAFQ